MTARVASQTVAGNLGSGCVLRLHGCPCGFYGDPQKECTCSPSMVARYQRRISGPLLDRMDLFVEVPRVEYEKLMDNSSAEESAQTRQRLLQLPEKVAMAI